MPTTKGKSKAGKAKKASNKTRRASPKASARKTRGAAPGKKTTKRAKTTGPKAARRPAGKLKRSEAGSVWIGPSPVPMDRPTEERGDKKAGSESGRVVIL